MIPGNQLNIGGTDYIVPPINLRLDFEYAEALDKLRDPESKLKDRQFAELLEKPFVENLRRNYPDFNVEQFRELARADLADALFAMLFKAGYAHRPLSVVAPVPESAAQPKTNDPPAASSSAT